MIEILLGAGFLLIAGFGTWRGLGLFSHAIDNKHEREVARLSTERMEKSIRLEIDQNKAMAEIEQMKDHPELSAPQAESALVNSDESPEGYLCTCRRSPAPHVHIYEQRQDSVCNIHAAGLANIRAGNLDKVTLRGKSLSHYVLLKPKR